MNPFSDNFLNYDDIPLDFDKFGDNDFSLTSPNSDSTTIYAQTHSPPLQGDFYVINTQQTDVYQYENSYASPQDYSTGTGAVTPIQDRTTPEEKLVSKSKRIQKRTEAKERTKVKQEAKAFFEGIDTKFLPEGYDDPNLDERTKKKMIQMVRNRISAQNSRDRRKNRLQQLEEINEQLLTIDPQSAAKMSVAPINPRPMLQELIGKDIVVRLKWGEAEYKGRLVSIDSYMNVQLSGAQEFIDQKKTGDLGEVLIRCNNVLWIRAAEQDSSKDIKMSD